MALSPLLLAVTLMPLTTSARPFAPFTLSARQNAPASIKHYLTFDIVFSIALFIALIGSFAWVASRWAAGAQPGELFSRLYATCSRQLADFGRSTFVEGATAPFRDANNAGTTSVPRRGGASYPVATVPWGIQAGGPRKVGAVRMSGERAAGVPSSVHAVV